MQPFALGITGASHCLPVNVGAYIYIYIYMSVPACVLLGGPGPNLSAPLFKTTPKSFEPAHGTFLGLVLVAILLNTNRQQPLSKLNLSGCHPRAWLLTTTFVIKYNHFCDTCTKEISQKWGPTAHSNPKTLAASEGSHWSTVTPPDERGQ